MLGAFYKHVNGEVYALFRPSFGMHQHTIVNITGLIWFIKRLTRQKSFRE